MESPASGDIYRKIVEGTSDGIIVGDREGTVVLWNGGAETIFGYRAGEILGKPMDLIIPEKLKERHWEGYRRVMDGGKSKYGTELLAVPAVRKDGTRISIEFSIVLLADKDGIPSGAAAIVRDVTARWQREKELSERLASAEKSQRT
jgi:PAS domain S-box-containing protein